MAIQGSLEEAALPDVLQLLSLGKKTGCLSLTERETQGEICLDNGLVCHAAVFSRRDRLGDMLVRTGRITQQQLDEAVTLQENGGRHVSQTLLASGQVERTELERFVRMQVEEAVYFMFTWRTGSFAFTSSVRPKHQEFLVAIDPEGLLLEGARRVDEWSLIEKKIPSLDLVFRLDRSRLDGAPALTSEQQQVLPLIDGTRDVHGIIELTGMAEFDVAKALYGLITAGFAKLVERRTAMRHLDYRELLAYVVREAEFAEPDRRRAAARHIADCATCTQRLKTIHVRRTGAIPALSTPADGPEPAPAPEPAATKGPTVTATMAPGNVERRVSDRRVLDDRRGDERRRGEERRKSRSPEWEQPGRDRRSGGDRRVESRRISERRLAPAGGRESAAILATRPLTLPQRSRSGERRVTGPRRIRPSGLDQATPDQPRRNTGERIRLRPADDKPATLSTPPVAPPVERPAERRRAPKDDLRERSPSVEDGVRDAAGTGAGPTASPPVEADERGTVTPPPTAPSPSRTRKPKRRSKKARQREVEVPEPPAETVGDSAGHVQPPEQDDGAAGHLAETAERSRAVLPGTPTEARQATDPPPPTKPDAETTPVPPPPRPATTPAQTNRTGRPPARSTDIEWLVSPDEANHLLRTSRIGLAAPASDTGTAKPGPAAEGAKPAPPAKPARTDAAPPAVTPPGPKGETAPAVERRAPRPQAKPPAATPAETTPAPKVAAAPHKERTPALDEVAAAAPERVAAQRGPAVTPAPLSPLRWLPIAAAAVVLIGIGWVARPLLQGADSPTPAPATPIIRQDAALAPAPVPVEAAPAETPTPPAAEPEAPPQPPVREAAPARPVAREAAPPPTRQPTPAVVPPPAGATISGTVRDGASGAALAGVRVTIPGTAFSTTTDASGSYALRDVPAGPVTLAATADGRLPGTQTTVLRAGEPAQVDFGLTAPAPEPAPPPAAAPPAPAPTPVEAREADEELASGNWTVTDAATASARLRNTIATIPELWVESIAITETGSRPRARVALLTTAGERIVLTETRSGAPIVGATPRVTALRIIPGSEAYPVTTGTASFGSLLVTAKTTLDPDTLRALLTKLAELN